MQFKVQEMMTSCPFKAAQAGIVGFGFGAFFGLFTFAIQDPTRIDSQPKEREKSLKKDTKKLLLWAKILAKLDVCLLSQSV